MQHQLGHCPVVPIRQFLREMRGGSQARLVRAADSQVYVAKFSNNPQGRRTLINERIASYLIEKLGIASPSTVLLSLSDEIIRQEDACFRVGTGRVPIVAGIHLGITCPANPFTTRILDVAPPRLYGLVENRSDFALTYVFDIWVSQTDRRQAIFVPLKKHASLRLRAYMIDHGFSFSGSQWAFCDGPVFFPEAITLGLSMESLCQKAVARISALPERDIMGAIESIPASWYEGDQMLLARLLESLCRRRDRLSLLVNNNLQTMNSKGGGPTT